MNLSPFRMLLLFIATFLFFPQIFAQQDGTSQKEIEVSFENACQDTLLVLVHYKNSKAEWVTKGWYWVPPGESRFVLTTPNARLYYHARNVAGDRVWQDKENGWKFKGIIYGFRQMTVEDKVWDYTKRLVCE